MSSLATIFEGSPCVADMIHVANILYLVSYLVRDIFWLRILTVIAIGSLMPYYFTCGDEPLWPAIWWNALFLGVNLVQIGLIVHERWPRALQDAERQIYDQVFSDLAPGEFIKLLGVGGWRESQPDEVLVQDGSVVENMMVLADGVAEVRKGDRLIAALEPGQFVGEMSFLSGHTAGADVVTPSPARLMSWPQAELEEFLDKHPSIAFKLRGVLGRDVVNKLRIA